MIKEILHSPTLVLSFLFPLRFWLGNFLERRFFAHDFDRRAAIRVDLASMLLFLAVFFPAAQYVSHYRYASSCM
jgi:hypothetical protein